LTKRALFIEHDYVSLGGPVWRAFKKRGYEIERFLIVPKDKYHTPNVVVEFPDFNKFDVIVPMGAPYGAYEDERIGNWLTPEITKLRDAHNAGIPILGICFGGQVMARALGGSVARSPKAELGWYEIESDDPTLISKGPWFEYHWDRWQNPPGAKEIARSAIATQAFTMGRTLGLQFHPEIDPEVLEEWLAMDGGCAEVESEGVSVEELRARTKAEARASELRADELVGNFLDRVATTAVVKSAL
jgi:GMP synthase-like glutamine amidotransferase